MIVTRKDCSFREKDEKSIDLRELVNEYQKHSHTSFTYMGTEADHLEGVFGFLKLAKFELIHLLKLKPMLPGALKQHLANERSKFNSVQIRSERGKIIFDYHNLSFILDRHLSIITVSPQRFLAQRISQTPYSFTPGTRGIWFAERYYFTWDVVDMVATNEFAFAVAGGNTIQIFENGENFRVTAKAKKICWGPEGLYYVNENNVLELVKEFKYGAKTYQTRSLRNFYGRSVGDQAMLVCCGKAMCVVYRPSQVTLGIDIVNGASSEFPMVMDVGRRAMHLGCFYWSNTLTVYYILKSTAGQPLEYHETNFELF